MFFFPNWVQNTTMVGLSGFDRPTKSHKPCHKPCNDHPPPTEDNTITWYSQTSLKCPVILPWNLLQDIKTSSMEDNWVLLLSRTLSNVSQRFYETKESPSNPYCIYSWKLDLGVTERPQLHRDGPTRVNLISSTSKQWRQLTATKK